MTTEVYNSGSIKINNIKTFSKQYDISKYIDVTTANAIVINVVAYNEVGEKGSKSITLSYTDKIPPTCTIKSISPSTGWIGKDDYKNGIKRKIVAECSDAESGCKRATFTSTWPKKNAKSVTTATISVYDNAGNEGKCSDVNINVDVVGPSATLKAKSGNTVVTKRNHEVNDKTTSDTVKVDDYNNLSSDWMNKTNYPNGVTYEVTATDDNLDSWTWEVNAKDQLDVDEKAISSTNPDGKTGDFTNSNTINVGFTGEGKRYGVLTIKDKAGNKVTYKIYANIDKTDPSCLSSYSKPSNYNGSWTNKDVILIGECSDSGSGCKSNAKETITTDTNGNVSPGIVSDNAGNTVTCASKEVKVDKTEPNCKSSGGNSNWVNYNITLNGECSDSGSGCKGNVSKTFSNDINTTTASPGSVYDNVGNKKDCPSNQTVKIDKTPPFSPIFDNFRNIKGSNWTSSGFRRHGGLTYDETVNVYVKLGSSISFFFDIDNYYNDNSGGSGIRENKVYWAFYGRGTDKNFQCFWSDVDDCQYRTDKNFKGYPEYIHFCLKSIDNAGNTSPISCEDYYVSGWS